jgi:hypothetical protein
LDPVWIHRKNGGDLLNIITSPSSEYIQKRSNDPENHTPVSILNLISNRQVSKILISTYKVPKSVQTLSKINEIPIAACYRKVKILEELGFLRCVESRLNHNGKRVRYYQCQILNAHFFMEKGKFRARVQLASGTVDDYGGSRSREDM